MIRDLLKWVVPGLATVLAGSTLSLAMTSSDIAQTIQSETAATVERAGFDWAELSYAMRDVTLSGTTTDQRNVDSALRRVSMVPGVRAVGSNVTLAPLAAPYRLEANLVDDKIALSGGIPDETTRQSLLNQAATDDSALELRSGMPERQLWVAGARFAIDQLRFLDQGGTSISDLTVDIKGRARSQRDFRDLLIVLRAGPPAGLTLGEVAITPALVSPYHWSAISDGKRIEISGFVPDDAIVDRYRSAETSGLAVATGLALGSGEPDGFAELSQKLIEHLSQLEYGSASIVDGESSLIGAPATAAVAQAIVDDLQSAGSIIELEPPRIDDYWVSATLQSSGALIFDGYAPDAATRDAVQALPGAVTEWMQLGRGAPERYQSALDFGLAALQRMSEGRFAMRENVISINGVARSGEDYLVLQDSLAGQAPQGFVLARAEIMAPPAANYQWTATKAVNGEIALSGLVPSQAVAASLLVAAGSSAQSDLRFASGEPRNFEASAQTGLLLLDWLEQGRVDFDGSGWTVTGTASSAIDKAAIEADFISRKLAAAGWSMAVAAPAVAEAPAVAAPEPVPTEPYVWSATKDLAGMVRVEGLVPAEQLQRVVALRIGERLSDMTTIDPPAPQGFPLDVLAAIDALSHLADGFVSYDGEQWRIDGNLLEAGGQSSVVNALASAATPSDQWRLTLLEPPVAVESQPAPDAVPAEAEVLVETVEQPAEPKSEPEPEPVAVDPDYAFSASRSEDGSVILSGQVPSDEVLNAIAALTDGDTAAVSIAPGAPEGFVSSAETGLTVLSTLISGQLDFSNGVWRIVGVADDETVRRAALAATAADDAASWTNLIEAPEPVVSPTVEASEPVAKDADEPPAPVSETMAKKVDISICAGPIDDFSGRNAILFQSGAALIAKESAAALDELIIILAECPDALIRIEGHTDADGDARLNLGLSVARAEAVVSALIERGIDPQRLYAVGFGETSPIADNSTSAGKRLNRRIVVTVSDEHY